MTGNNDRLSASMQAERQGRVSIVGEGKFWTNEPNTARDTMNEPSEAAVAGSPSSSKAGGSSTGEGVPVTTTTSRLSRTSQRAQKPRRSGGFLLQDTVVEQPDRAEESPPQKKKHSRRLLQSIRPKSSKAHEKTTSAISREAPATIAEQDTTHTHPSSPPKAELKVKKTRDRSQDRPTSAEQPKPERSGLDVESAQIVDMALRVSQSRRLATQRPPSQQVPPRLSPIPDTTAVSSLRQHLLQQRKISRNGSPRPERATSRNAPGLRHALESFDVTAPDGGFRYHVSRSTLARVQKAKDYIELMAQYRRLIDNMPPLRATGGAHPPPTPASMRSSPRTSTTYNALGRQYNPLQYIRNRKVRARERQVIDGDAQGFNDVAQVTAWIDEIEHISTSGEQPSAAEATRPLPLYLGAELQAADTSAALTSSSTSAKPTRPRVDWFVEPADMIADAYWLEQGSNKLLIEDRHWSRLYPRGSELEVSLRNSLQHSGEPSSAGVSRPATGERVEDSGLDKQPEATALKAEVAEPFSGSPRERSRLRPRGQHHHRHNSSLHLNHDFLRPQRGSLSDLSDSDHDFKDSSRFRSGTITATSKDILAKQMMEMIAKEEKEGDVRPTTRPEPLKSPPPVSYRTPEKAKNVSSKPPSRLHSRQNSFNNASDWEEKIQELSSSLRHRRPQHAKLDIPIDSARESLEAVRTAPNSPEPGPSRDTHLQISPLPSRGGSPTRNPFAKVKQIFRDQGRDRYTVNIDDKIREMDVDTDLSRWTAPDPFMSQAEASRSSVEGRLSSSSNRPQIGRPPQDLGKGHRRLSSLKAKTDDAGGIRGLLKAPSARIDTVLRNSVSKLGDIIWRKETDQTDMVLSEGSISSDSDGEGRGRRRGPRRSRDDSTADRSKSYLSQMPEFHHTGRPPTAAPGSGRGTLSDINDSRRQSIQSRGGLSDAKAQQASSQAVSKLSLDECTESFLESVAKDKAARTHDKRLTAMLSVPPSFNSSRHYSSMSWHSDHRWSTTTRSRSPEQHAPLSRREIARLRALLLSSGVMAMEIARRANHARHLPIEQPRRTPRREEGDSDGDASDTSCGINWREIADLSADRKALCAQAVSPADTLPFVGGILNDSVKTSTDRWQASADKFAHETSPGLHADLEALRIRLGVDLSSMARAACDDADETNRQVAQTQRLQVKVVVDVIEKMLRRRRRRFRWVRRGLWLGVEWVLVGFMWYVWFVVMMLRGILGIGTGAVRAVRWLLWL